MKLKISLSLTCLLIALFYISCNDDPEVSFPQTPIPPNTPNQPNTSDWLIPVNEVFDGGPGQDGIPSIDQPQFWGAADGDNFLDPNDLIVGVNYDGIARAYPHEILDWHEIVNDDIGDRSVAITYCPLTGTASGWNRILQGGAGAGQKTTFGVSGLLYNTNLIPYDRVTGSNWSQMLLQSVNGALKGEFIQVDMVVETTWNTWKQLYPETEVLSTNTGFNRNYGLYPYGDYRTNNNRLLFPVSNEDNRLPGKERVHGVINDESTVAQIFTFGRFEEGLSMKREQWFGKDLLVVGSEPLNLIVSFYNELEGGENLEFTVTSTASLPVILTDNEGNEWNLFGEAISGPRRTQQLTPTRSYMGYYFAFGAFYPDVEIN